MEQAVVKILLLGICGYGSNYIKEISERDIPGIKIEGICEVVPNAADLYPIIKEQNIPIYQTPEDFYKEHTADLAVVSTPIHLHYSQIVTCLTHGSNVLTEKPVCTSVEGARKLEQLEKETGKFISVGYQLNYSRDVLALKQDILDDRFGKPIYMKALHAMRRGDKYYARNSWAGHIDVKGCAVNDSPFNNACAHQFQVMTFLLGESLERAAELADVQADPYKGNPNVENFDTITVQAHTVSGVPLWYGTGHAIVDKKLGPIAEYRFEKGTVYFGKDFGSGPIAEYVYIGDTGERIDYGRIPKGERLQKFYDAIEAVRTGKHPVCTAGEQRSDDPELAENQNRVMEAARRGSTEAMEQALCRLAGTVCQAVRASEQEAAADEKGRLYLEMRDYIEANYSDATLNVNALSEHFDRPAPFVSRYFKEMNGTNLTQYIHKVRLEHVKEKLLQDEKLETIAVTCGFGSLRSFLRIFKQYEGVTPTQYRELHSKKEETTNENI